MNAGYSLTSKGPPMSDTPTPTTKDHDCPCGPTVELVRTSDGDSWIHTHHSLDGRERTETR